MVEMKREEVATVHVPRDLGEPFHVEKNPTKEGEANIWYRAQDGAINIARVLLDKEKGGLRAKEPKGHVIFRIVQSGGPDYIVKHAVPVGK